MTEQKQPIRFQQYMEKLTEQRKREKVKTDIINEHNKQRGHGLTSPTTLTSTEETRLFMEYMDRSNLFNISKRDERRGKTLTYIRFFKAKRNQQVEVYSRVDGKTIYTEGKVSAVGRDFVMLTNLKERIWIPYAFIESANVPYGIPNYSNSHQHYLYDNDLRRKLVNDFGSTVGKRDILKQQFYQETLQTNLSSWRDTWVEVFLTDGTRRIGKLVHAEGGELTLGLLRTKTVLLIKEVSYIKTIRWFHAGLHMLRPFARFLKMVDN